MKKARAKKAPIQIVVRPDGQVMFGTMTEEMLDIVEALSPPDQPPRAARHKRKQTVPNRERNA